jgi:1-acyl-sn-glycerol-3-phosphate acyltransferase
VSPLTLLRFSLGSIVMVAAAVVFMVLMLFLLPWRALRLKTCNYYGKIVGRTVLACAGARPVIHNRQRLHDAFPAIYVSNHTSTLDMWMGMWLCPVGGGGIAKKEIMRIPGIGQLYFLSGHPLIDRSNRERAIATMNKMARFMKKHRLGLWIWPEGTRSMTGELGPFKKGFVHAALATEMPIVPIVVWNATRIWPRGRTRFQPGDLHIEVLPAIQTTDWTQDTVLEHVDQVRQAFVTCLAQPSPELRDAP